MRLKICLLTVCSLLMVAALSAQGVSKDSITTLKQQKESLEINKRINDRKLQLAKLQNSLDQKTKNAQSAAEEAQRSADNNSQTAAKLTTDPQDKSLARSANKSAKEAKRDARQARKAASDLDGLKKDIENLKKKISDDEMKLSGMPGSTIPSAVPKVD